ncbi:hypothetical protein BC628DRAFT_605506 [Trametes gibbosa]|nr:hypothetical protein BC628DRAFT_605506 [Trametes gibbosa]
MLLKRADECCITPVGSIHSPAFAHVVSVHHDLPPSSQLAKPATYSSVPTLSCILHEHPCSPLYARVRVTSSACESRTLPLAWISVWNATRSVHPASLPSRHLRGRSLASVGRLAAATRMQWQTAYFARFERLTWDLMFAIQTVGLCARREESRALRLDEFRILCYAALNSLVLRARA